MNPAPPVTMTLTPTGASSPPRWPGQPVLIVTLRAALI